VNKNILVYTDGSCDTTSGDGGWAYLLVFNGHKKEDSGFEAKTTNNRMELTAAVRALETLKEACEVTLTTDSQYMRKAFTDGWLANWQRNGWKTASKDPVKNKDLWLELLALSKKHDIHWHWTEGHAGHEENERVDTLALKARKNTRKGVTSGK
jgi:ribonuclease HI